MKNGMITKINIEWKNNYSPIWPCRKENTGSYMLAKSLGFKEALILPYYELVK